VPRILSVQAAGASPFHASFTKKFATRERMRAETVATAIRIGAPVNWRKAIAAIRDSEGEAGTVTDLEILDAQTLLARLEGLFVEPASAAPIAYLRRRRLEVPGPVVCVATGNGLKDPDAVLGVPVLRERIHPDLAAVRRLIGS